MVEAKGKRVGGTGFSRLAKPKAKRTFRANTSQQATQNLWE
jgi:hypothetical protein